MSPPTTGAHNFDWPNFPMDPMAFAAVGPLSSLLTNQGQPIAQRAELCRDNGDNCRRNHGSVEVPALANRNPVEEPAWMDAAVPGAFVEARKVEDRHLFGLLDDLRADDTEGAHTLDSEVAAPPRLIVGDLRVDEIVSNDMLENLTAVPVKVHGSGPADQRADPAVEGRATSDA